MPSFAICTEVLPLKEVRLCRWRFGVKIVNQIKPNARTLLCRYEVATRKYVAWPRICKECCFVKGKKYPQKHFVPVDPQMPFVLYHTMTDRNRKIRRKEAKGKRAHGNKAKGRRAMGKKVKGESGKEFYKDRSSACSPSF